MPTPLKQIQKSTPSRKNPRPHSVALGTFKDSPIRDMMKATSKDDLENFMNSPNNYAHQPITKEQLRSPMTPSSKISTKKRLAAEITEIGLRYNEIENERLEMSRLNESIKKSIDDLANKRRKKIGKLKSKNESLKKTNKELTDENEELTEELNKVKKELDSFVTSNWKVHVYNTLNEEWFDQYMRNYN